MVNYSIVDVFDREVGDAPGSGVECLDNYLSAGESDRKAGNE
jgi:hypothetical protein